MTEVQVRIEYPYYILTMKSLRDVSPQDRGRSDKISVGITFSYLRLDESWGHT